MPSHFGHEITEGPLVHQAQVIGAVCVYCGRVVRYSLSADEREGKPVEQKPKVYRKHSARFSASAARTEKIKQLWQESGLTIAEIAVIAKCSRQNVWVHTKYLDRRVH